MAALAFPQIDPVAVHLGPLAVRWYGLAYVVGFVAAGLVMWGLNRTWRMGMSDDDVLDTVIAAVLGLMVGARLGYVLFYGGAAYLAEPLRVFAVWDGGMSFHGGLIGILVGGWLASRRVGVPFLRLCDAGAVGAPIGIFFGRLANFVNGELWGRPSDVPWAIVFPGADAQPRHPSQLYEATLEGLVLFGAMWWLSRRKRPDGVQLGWFLVLYGVFRLALETFREPDVQLGFIAGPLTMGQLLSVPMLVGGVWLLWRGRDGYTETKRRS